jgi:cobalt-zinc-cadmium resistance protein CzcA
MLHAIIRFSVRQKALVFALTGVVALWGLISALQLPVDAVPDITNNQVQVVTTAPALAPQEVEQFITYPVELVMANLPGVLEVRSVSRSGLSIVTVVFEDNVETALARQRVNEQIQVAQADIPSEYGTPTLMPVTTGLGEVYQYTLEVDQAHRSEYTLEDLRSLHDWQIKRQLAGIPGVVEVSSFGGKVKQYEVAVHPDRLQESGLTMSDVFEAVSAGNRNAGGAYIEKGEEAWYIRMEGLYRQLEDLRLVALPTHSGLPLTVGDIATVRYGFAPRYGALTKDGQGEVVGGICLMLKGANSNDVTHAIDERVASIQSTLPPGIRIAPYLNRSELVGRTLGTVERNLLEGALVVGLLLFFLLGNWRAALVVTSVIPLSLLFALGCMHYFGVSANLMSLGAIDFGIVVDGAVIVVEATLMAFHRGGLLSAKDRDETVVESAGSIYGSAAFGVLIILVVFLPILTLSGIEGKMFKPMAQTVVFALLGALLFSTTYVPALVALVLRPEVEENRSERFFHRLRLRYARILDWTLQRGRAVLTGVVAAFAVAVWGFMQLGSVFLPSLEEGDLAMQVSIPTGSNLQEMIRVTTSAEKKLKEHFPEVRHVVSKIGTAEVPTDPMPVEAADVMVLLEPKEKWTSASTREELVGQMEAVLDGVWGAQFEFTQPIQLRFNELISGSKSDIALLVYGDHLDTLANVAQKMAAAVRGIPGAEDVKVEATQGMKFHRWVPNRQALAYHGVSTQQVGEVVEMAYAGQIAGSVFEDQKRFDVAVRLSPEERLDGSGHALYVRNHNGDRVPLTAVADRVETVGPSQISRSKASRRISVGINVRGRDVASVVADIERALGEKVALPPGYSLHIGGDFENLQQALDRLKIAVPVALALIFALLYLAFRSAAFAALVFSAIPLSALGGIAALALRGMPFSISAGIGFIALFGVAVLNGLVLVARVRQLESTGVAWSKAVVAGSADRLRPVLVTATVAALGFVPMAFSSSAGAEVQKPLATVVIGGLVSATVLTLGVLPILLIRLKKWLPGSYASGAAGTTGVLLLLVFSSGTAWGQTQPWPSLAAVQEQALRVHADVASAQGNQRIAQLKPNVLLGAAQGTVQYGQMNAEPRDYYFSLEQPLGSLAEHVRRWRRNESEIGLRATELELTQQAVSLAAALAYADYWRWGRECAWRSQWTARLNQDAARVEARVAQGDWSTADGAAFRLLRNRWQSDLVAAQAKWAESASLLAALTHQRWTAVLEVTPTLPEHLTMEPSADTALAPRFLRWAQESAHLAQAEAMLTKTQWAPQWSVGGFQQQLERVNGFNGVFLGVTLPIAAHVPLKNSAIATVQQATVEAQATQSLVDWHAKKEAARHQWTAWKTASAQAISAQKDADLLLRVLTTQLELGELSFSDFFLQSNAALEGGVSALLQETERFRSAALLNFYTVK